MKSITNLFMSVEKWFSCLWKRVQSVFKGRFIIFSVVSLVLILALFLLANYKGRSLYSSEVIVNDISVIINALSEIDKECNILSIKNDRNYVDFLNVEKFVSSEVGCLNLAFPKNWAGPYVQDNPTLQGKFYEIIKTTDGLFIVPGSGVELPNGLIVGKDFDFDKGISLQDMLEVGGCLNFDGMQLAGRLDFEIGDWGPQPDDKRYYEISGMLEEFNQAMPFTYNQTSTATF